MTDRDPLQVSQDIIVVAGDCDGVVIRSAISGATIEVDDEEILPLIVALATLAAEIYASEYVDKRFI